MIKQAVKHITFRSVAKIIKNKTEPKITVCITFTPYKQHALKCFDSIFNQSLEEIEVLCIFEDYKHVFKFVEEYAQEYSNIKILVQDRIETLYDYVHGEYIFFIESSDWLSVLALEYAYDKINKNESDILLISNYFYSEKNYSIYESNYYETISSNADVLTSKTIKREIFTLPKYPNNLYDVKFLKNNNIQLPVSCFDKVNFFIQALSLSSNILISDKSIFYKRLTRENTIEKYVLENFNGSLDKDLDINQLLDRMDDLIRFFKENEIYGDFKYYLLNYVINSFYKVYLIRQDDITYFKLSDKFEEYSKENNTDYVLNLNMKNINFYRKILNSRTRKELELMYENEGLELEKNILKQELKRANNQSEWNKKQYNNAVNQRKQKVKEIEDTLNKTKKEKQEVIEVNKRLNSKLEEVSSSSSWKITKIFRKIGFIKSILILIILAIILLIIVVVLVTTVVLLIK